MMKGCALSIERKPTIKFERNWYFHKRFKFKNDTIVMVDLNGEYWNFFFSLNEARREVEIYEKKIQQNKLTQRNQMASNNCGNLTGVTSDHH